MDEDPSQGVEVGKEETKVVMSNNINLLASLHFQGINY